MYCTILIHQTMNSLCCSTFQKLSSVVTYRMLLSYLNTMYTRSFFILSWPSHMERATGTSAVARLLRVEDYLHWKQEPLLDTVESFCNECKTEVHVQIHLAIWFEKMIGESCIVLPSSQRGRELPSVRSNNLIAISKMPYMLPTYLIHCAMYTALHLREVVWCIIALVCTTTCKWSPHN